MREALVSWYFLTDPDRHPTPSTITLLILTVSYCMASKYSTVCVYVWVVGWGGQGINCITILESGVGCVWVRDSTLRDLCV